MGNEINAPFGRTQVTKYLVSYQNCRNCFGAKHRDPLHISFTAEQMLPYNYRLIFFIHHEARLCTLPVFLTRHVYLKNELKLN